MATVAGSELAGFDTNGINQAGLKTHSEMIMDSSKSAYFHLVELVGQFRNFKNDNSWSSNSADNFKQAFEVFIDNNFTTMISNINRYSQILDLVLGEYIKTDQEIFEEYAKQIDSSGLNSKNNNDQQTKTNNSNSEENKTSKKSYSGGGGGGGSKSNSNNNVSKNNNSTISEELETEASWPNNEFTKVLPRPNFGTSGKINWQTSDSFSYTIKGCNSSNYSNYLELLKNNGFSVKEGSNYYIYNNYKTFVSFESNELTISIFKEANL